MNEKQTRIFHNLHKKSACTARMIPQVAEIEERSGGRVLISWSCFYRGEDNPLTNDLFMICIGPRGGVTFWNGRKWKRAKYMIIERYNRIFS